MIIYIFRIKPITEDLGLLSFNASSWYNDATAPHFAQLYSKENGYWKPSTPSENEYLQIYLGSSETIYGVQVSGNPLDDEFVTGFKVAYSMDGISFSYVSFHGQPEVIFTFDQNYKNHTNTIIVIHNRFSAGLPLMM